MLTDLQIVVMHFQTNLYLKDVSVAHKLQGFGLKG